MQKNSSNNWSDKALLFVALLCNVFAFSFHHATESIKRITVVNMTYIS